MKPQGTKPSVVLISVSALFAAGFMALMVYAMQHNPNVLVSALLNKSAPTFQANTAQGNAFSMDAILNKKGWIIVNFWSTTCVVCREEAHELESFYKSTTTETDKNTLQFVSINIQEERNDILQYLESLKLSYPVVMDVKGNISLDYGVTGTPETFFIDPQGKVRHRIAGAVDKDTILRTVEWLNHSEQTQP